MSGGPWRSPPSWLNRPRYKEPQALRTYSRSAPLHLCPLRASVRTQGSGSSSPLCTRPWFPFSLDTSHRQPRFPFQNLACLCRSPRPRPSGRGPGRTVRPGGAGLGGARCGLGGAGRGGAGRGRPRRQFPRAAPRPAPPAEPGSPGRWAALGAAAAGSAPRAVGVPRSRGGRWARARVGAPPAERGAACLPERWLCGSGRGARPGLRVWESRAGWGLRRRLRP